jgi:hypothetical protein
MPAATGEGWSVAEAQPGERPLRAVRRGAPLGAAEGGSGGEQPQVAVQPRGRREGVRVVGPAAEGAAAGWVARPLLRVPEPEGVGPGEAEVVVWGAGRGLVEAMQLE